MRRGRPPANSSPQRHPFTSKRNTMLDKELQKEILDSIGKSGHSEETELKVNTNINHVLNFSSGAARIQTTVVRKAKLILSQPQALQALSNLQIRCALCKRVISYPCWYHSIRYAVNHFHYFICFDKDSPNKPSTKCYRRE